MVEKTYARINLGIAFAVQVQLDADIGFTRLALDRCLTCHAGCLVKLEWAVLGKPDEQSENPERWLRIEQPGPNGTPLEGRICAGPAVRRDLISPCIGHPVPSSDSSRRTFPYKSINYHAERLVPELPDVKIYLEALQRTVGSRQINKIDLRSPFVVRTFEPDLFVVEGTTIRRFQRLGKRIVWELDDDLFLVFHLMIAGRFHWKKAGTKPRTKIDLAAFHFDHGTLMLTEASQKKRASIHVVQGERSLAAYNPGGIDVLACTLEEFRRELLAENRTLKRALTNPRRFDGIGNAYSDEILHAARLSPIKWTGRLNDAEIARLFESTRTTLETWIDRLREQTGDGFPDKVTAFRKEMRVHGKFGHPCPKCDTPVQRIVYADNETNYCPRCQTEGKVLADRSLSRLLKSDWPKSIEELEG